MFNFNNKTEVPAEVLELVQRVGSSDPIISAKAHMELAKALTEPLRQGVLVGDIVGGLFEPIKLAPGATSEFPLDLLAPGEEHEFVAYTNPGNGRIPERQVEADYVMVPTYGITASIDWLLRFARESRWDVVSRALQVLRAQFTKKINDDGWHTLLTAAADRNVLIYDADANAGQFTKRLISLMSLVMRRNGGGNTASTNRGRLTDVFFSPEGMEDIRNWGVDQVDEATRNRIFNSANGTLTDIFGVRLHDLDELGEGQEYQDYFLSDLGGALETDDIELMVGMDLNTNDSFIMPIKQDIQLFQDPVLHRQQRAGYYGWAELGFAALDNRRIILGSY
jgi:hypothetical protein